MGVENGDIDALSNKASTLQNMQVKMLGWKEMSKDPTYQDFGKIYTSWLKIHQHRNFTIADGYLF